MLLCSLGICPRPATDAHLVMTRSSNAEPTYDRGSSASWKSTRAVASASLSSSCAPVSSNIARIRWSIGTLTWVNKLPPGSTTAPDSPTLPCASLSSAAATSWTVLSATCRCTRAARRLEQLALILRQCAKALLVLLEAPTSWLSLSTTKASTASSSWTVAVLSCSASPVRAAVSSSGSLLRHSGPFCDTVHPSQRETHTHTYGQCTFSC
eukprot:scaffold539_cov359-Prasinococcus_capsulatus_cf.AAC.10